MPDATPEERVAALEAGFQSQLGAGMFGTPEYLIEQIRQVQAVGNIAHLITLHSFGDMPREDVERSMRLFAKEVLPVIQKIPVEPAEAVPFAEFRAGRLERAEGARQ
jgi:alkanesulfonate monooxygenase SsuD/methylene tetrahydromethanopterin reductase-like flavin-dependent oxidoreductase (luciferase family)